MSTMQIIGFITAMDIRIIANSRCQYELKMDYSPSGKIQYKNINSTIMKKRNYYKRLIR